MTADKHHDDHHRVHDLDVEATSHMTLFGTQIVLHFLDSGVVVIGRMFVVEERLKRSEWHRLIGLRACVR
ncbi:hypothetical protein VI817_009465 [Penicillium citrinum]|nr:hypothetical protein VI817_009465 [Penicillium citrinum]